MEVSPGDVVMRMAPVPPEPKRSRSGLVQFGTYTVADARADLIRVDGVVGWHRLSCFDVVLHEPCA